MNALGIMKNMMLEISVFQMSGVLPLDCNRDNILSLNRGIQTHFSILKLKGGFHERKDRKSALFYFD